MQFFFGIKAKKMCLKKAYFLGHLVIQAVEAIMLGSFYKIYIFTKFTFLQNLHFYKIDIFTKYLVPEKSVISIML